MSENLSFYANVLENYKINKNPNLYELNKIIYEDSGKIKNEFIFFSFLIEIYLLKHSNNLIENWRILKFLISIKSSILNENKNIFFLKIYKTCVFYINNCIEFIEINEDFCKKNIEMITEITFYYNLIKFETDNKNENFEFKEINELIDKIYLNLINKSFQIKNEFVLNILSKINNIEFETLINNKIKNLKFQKLKEDSSIIIENNNENDNKNNIEEKNKHSIKNEENKLNKSIIKKIPPSILHSNSFDSNSNENSSEKENNKLDNNNKNNENFEQKLIEISSVYYNYIYKISDLINYEKFKNEFFNKFKLKIISIGSFSNFVLNPFSSKCVVDLMIWEDKKKSLFNSLYELKQKLSNFESIQIDFSINRNKLIEDFNVQNCCLSFLIKNPYDYDLNNNKIVQINLFLNNQIYYHSSFIIGKLYNYLNNKNNKIILIHFYCEDYLLNKLKILDNNYEISILILNFLQYKFKIFNPKTIKNKEKFVYFKCSNELDYNYSYKNKIEYDKEFCFYFDYNYENLNKINENFSIYKLIIKFYEFIYEYFKWNILIYENKEYNIIKMDEELNFLNKIFVDNNFAQDDFLFTRKFIDNKISNLNLNDIKKLKSKTASLQFEISKLKLN